ncbi:hemolysin D [Gemmobacter tilapiae]|uniref:Hemolysin D n=2 Tax=Neogemmobacter tilapiae TaxID=875041 RepID=A0A918TSF2_9RHOB|nr:hemolysin D [Gemmobacter tilapiae]
MRMSTKIVLSVSVLALMVGLGTIAPVLAQETEAAETGGEAQIVLPAITVSTVTKRPLRDMVLASGLIGAVEEVQVQPLIEGQPIETLQAEVGDVVTEGQVLATLSLSTLELQKSQFVASLESAKATIAQAEAQVLEAQSSADEAQRVNERTEKLREQGTASQAQADTAQSAAISATARVTVARQSLEAARAQLALAQAQLANVELQLQRTKVVAPVSGEIIQRNALVGGIATAAGQPMFVIVKEGALELRADVTEADLARIKAGQTVTIKAVGATETLTGQVHLVEPRIDTATRLGTARIRIDHPELVRSGMFAEANILAAEHEAVAVPVTAVGSGPDGASVMRISADGAVERVLVKTGIRDGGFVEIVEGLADGQVVVTKAGAFVRPGDKINPVPDTAATN